MKKEIAKAGKQLYRAGIYFGLQFLLTIICIVIIKVSKMSQDELGIFFFGIGLLSLILFVNIIFSLMGAGNILRKIDNVQNEE